MRRMEPGWPPGRNGWRDGGILAMAGAAVI